MLREDLEKAPFVSFLVDASNHGNIKMFPIVVRYFLPTTGVHIKVLEFSSQKRETSEIIFSFISARPLQNSRLGYYEKKARMDGFDRYRRKIAGLKYLRHFRRQNIPHANMATIVAYILAIPGTSSSVEHIFASVNKIWREEKTRMQMKTININQ